MLVDKILRQIKEDPNLKWPTPLSLRPKGIFFWKYCQFHEGSGHSTDEYHELRWQIEELI